MHELIKQKLIEDGLYGDSVEITDIKPMIKENEQHYVVSTTNHQRGLDKETTYSNSDLLESMYDTIQELQDKLED